MSSEKRWGSESPYERVKGPPMPNVTRALAVAFTLLPLVWIGGCGAGSSKYTVDESSYQVQSRNYGRSSSLAAVERSQSKRMSYAGSTGGARRVRAASMIPSVQSDAAPSPPPRPPRVG